MTRGDTGGNCDRGAYWGIFEGSNLIYQDLSYHSRFSRGFPGLVSEATCFSLPSQDSWLLACLNSPLIWCWLWRKTIHGKDEVLRLKNIYTEVIPIAVPCDEARDSCEHFVGSIIEKTKSIQDTQRELLDWLTVEHSIESHSKKLEDSINLEAGAFVTEIRKLRGKKNPLSLAAHRSLKEEHTRTILPAQALAREALALERKISDLVNQAYGLTPEEIQLMWATAPPRMPIPGY